MFELSFLVNGFLFTVTTPNECTARMLRAITRHSRLWVCSKNGGRILVS